MDEISSDEPNSMEEPAAIPPMENQRLLAWTVCALQEISTRFFGLMIAAEVLFVAYAWCWQFRVSQISPLDIPDDRGMVIYRINLIRNYGDTPERIASAWAIIGLTFIIGAHIGWSIWRRRARTAQAISSWRGLAAHGGRQFLKLTARVVLLYALIPCIAILILPRFDFPQWWILDLSETVFYRYLPEFAADPMWAIALRSDSPPVRHNILNLMGDTRLGGKRSLEALFRVMETRDYLEAKVAMSDLWWQGEWPRMRAILKRFNDDPALVLRIVPWFGAYHAPVLNTEQCGMLEKAIIDTGPARERTEGEFGSAVFALLRANAETLPYDYLARLGLVPKDSRDILNDPYATRSVEFDLAQWLSAANDRIREGRHLVVGSRDIPASDSTIEGYRRALADPRNIDIWFGIQMRGVGHSGPFPELPGYFDEAMRAGCMGRLTDWLISFHWEDLYPERRIYGSAFKCRAILESMINACDRNSYRRPKCEVYLRRILESGRWDSVPLPFKSLNFLPNGRTYVNAPRTYGDYIRATLDATPEPLAFPQAKRR